MKRFLSALAVVVLTLAIAVSASASPITFNFSGEVDGLFEDTNTGFSGIYTISIVSDTNDLGSGSILGGTVPVLYYASPSVIATLSLSGETYDAGTLDPIDSFFSLTDTITDDVYVVFDTIGSALGFGLFDGTLPFDDTTGPFTGDIFTVFSRLVNTYDMKSGFGPFTTDNLLDSFVLEGGTVNLALNGPFALEFAPDGTSMTYSAVPEPSMLMLFGAGLAGLGLLRRKS